MAESHDELQTWVLILCNHFTLLKVIRFSDFESYSVSNLYKQILHMYMQNWMERTGGDFFFLLELCTAGFGYTNQVEGNGETPPMPSCLFFS